MREPISGRGFWISNLGNHFDSDCLKLREEDNFGKGDIFVEIFLRGRQDGLALCWSEIPWRRAGQPSLQGRQDRRREGGNEARREGGQERRRSGEKKARKQVEQNTMGIVQIKVGDNYKW